MHREIEDVQLRLVQLVDHEADDFFAMLSDHADAVSLAQAAQEILFRPCEFKTLLFGLQDLRHIAANHPANVDACLFLLGTTRAHNDLPSPRRASSSSSERNASASALFRSVCPGNSRWGEWGAPGLFPPD